MNIKPRFSVTNPYGVPWIPSTKPPVMLALIYQHQPDPSWAWQLQPDLDVVISFGAAEVHPDLDDLDPNIPGLVNIQKAMENGHRNSGLTHGKW